MRIDGLSKFEVHLLDIIWSIDTAEELQLWMSTLPPNTYRVVESLIQLMVLATIDEQVDRMMSFPDAEDIVKRINPTQ